MSKTDINPHTKRESDAVGIEDVNSRYGVGVNPKILVIVGPTASGKSALALELAKKHNGEIVSADSRQIYREMDIGTAKPSHDEMSEIPHHLIDIKNPDEDYSVGQYKKDSVDAINNILQKQKLPILVGGTGLYISSVVNNLEFPQVVEDKELRQKLEEDLKRDGLGSLWTRLVELDPEAEYIVDPKNPRRVIRALEVALVTGQPFTSQRQKGEPLFDCLIIGLNPPPEVLQKRISDRVELMVADGLVDEVKTLIEKYGADQKAFDAIGYREIIPYLRGECTLDQVKEEIIKNTRRYAKRQMTWFKTDERIHWLMSSSEAYDLVEKFL